MWIRNRATGLNTGRVFGNPPTERRFEITVFDVLRFRDGKLVEHWGVPDQLGLLVALELFPPRASAPEGSETLAGTRPGLRARAGAADWLRSGRPIAGSATGRPATGRTSPGRRDRDRGRVAMAGAPRAGKGAVRRPAASSPRQVSPISTTFSAVAVRSWRWAGRLPVR